MIGDLSGSPWLGDVGAVFSGYFGAADQVADVADLVGAVRGRNPNALFLCDPIAGDSRGLFQPEAMVMALRHQLVSLADIVTPNRYELGWLTGMPVDDNATIVAAARALGPKEVAVTSAFASAGEIGTALVTGDGAWLATHRALANVPHGTGDLFAALYLGHHLGGLGAPAVLERAASSVLRVIEIAVANHADEMPLAEGQDAFLAAPTGVTITRLD